MFVGFFFAVFVPYFVALIGGRKKNHPIPFYSLGELIV